MKSGTTGVKILQIIAATSFILLPSANAVVKTWDGGTGNWSDSHWSTNGAPPGSGDNVVISAGSTVTVSSSTFDLSSLDLTGTLIFTNWTTKLEADDVTINSGGKMLHAACDTNTVASNSNRIWIVCENMNVKSGATINGDFSGFRGGDYVTTYTWGQGPGGGLRTAGASYGGLGANGSYTPNEPGPIYGSSNGPALPGSGGGGHNASNKGTEGGGAVQIEASGHVVINGTVTVNGVTKQTQGGNGSGGGIHILCRTFGGTSGKLQANGGSSGKNSSDGGSGGGGRIVLIYDTVAQAASNAVAKPLVILSASQGSALNAHNGEPGTIFLSDNSFYPQVGQSLYGGELLIPGFTSFSVGDLTVVGGRVIFPAGFNLQIAGNLNIAGDGGGIELTNAIVSIASNATFSAAKFGRSYLYSGPASDFELGGDLFIQGSRVHLYCDAGGLTQLPGVLNVNGGEYHWYSKTGTPSTLQVGGNCIVTNGGSFHVQSGMTNGTTDYGALVTVDGNMTIATSSWVYAYSHSTNGGSPLFRLQDLTVRQGGGFNADGNGFEGGPDSTNLCGYGEGGGYRYDGGGYGGIGGKGGYTGGTPGPIYGSETTPIDPGSGGGYHQNRGGKGGGLVWIEAAGNITLDGTISANGGKPSHNQAGAGSGGGINLTCKTISGGASGLIQANGSDDVNDNQYNGGCGGGGRIAVSWAHDNYLGAIQALGGVGYDTNANGYPGTVHWQMRPPKGTLIMVR